MTLMNKHPDKPSNCPECKKRTYLISNNRYRHATTLIHTGANTNVKERFVLGWCCKWCGHYEMFGRFYHGRFLLDKEAKD